MTIEITQSYLPIEENIQITGSKSESNRMLLLQALYPDIRIRNLSNSHDSSVMQKALASGQEVVDIHHAGTAMRFLTAYFSIQDGRETVLTGSSRMQERPIKILVDALRQLGALITYEKTPGCPPLRIRGSKLKGNRVVLDAGVSSQYISALMLIAPKFPGGLEILLKGKITSVPYIRMTLQLLADCGIKGSFEGPAIRILPHQEPVEKTITVESDWSSASYFYSIAALAPAAKITLSSYKQKSYQGDSVLADIYSALGIATTYGTNSITLEKKTKTVPTEFYPDGLNLTNAPDIAQTIAVTCFGLGIPCYITGLHTLKIKETDRLEALKIELEKLGALVEITDDTLRLHARKNINSGVAIDTYQDHRMAMAFAPLGICTDINILEAEVVAKSYPDYWKDLRKLGITCIES